MVSISRALDTSGTSSWSMMVLARLRATSIFFSARFFLRNLASATFLMGRWSTLDKRSLASARSAGSKMGGGRMNLRSSSRNHSGRSSSSSRLYLLYPSSMMRSRSFLRSIFLPMARISAFSPSLMSSRSSLSSASSSSSSLLDSASASASTSTKDAPLSAPRRARDILLPTGSSPSSPAPPSSSLLSSSLSYVSSCTAAAAPPLPPPAFFLAASLAVSLAVSLASSLAALAASFFFLAAATARISS
mmetsp:Transcript_27561/g.67776  ORF Transcript_27561/g.67776 Transcript_27561/m.67776 type:complete len:247 (-) Transcript_27561:162-902(-)